MRHCTLFTCEPPPASGLKARVRAHSAHVRTVAEAVTAAFMVAETTHVLLIPVLVLWVAIDAFCLVDRGNLTKVETRRRRIE